MDKRFDIRYLKENELKFDGGKTKDPRVGLVEYGPRTPAEDSDHIVAKVGVIGSPPTLDAVEQLLDEMEGHIPPSQDERKRWKPPFPGLGEEPFKMSLERQKRWRQKINAEEIDEIKAIDGQSNRVEKAVELFEEKIETIYGSESVPDLLIVTIPEKLYNATTQSKSGDAKIQSDTMDLHNRVKLMGMRRGMPTQMIKPKTLRGEGTQDRSDVAWNLAVGTMYKVRGGHPWKLAELEEGTCFVGISFYRDKDNPDRTKTSMAQVFLETGESFVLKADPGEDEKLGQGNNHLTEDDAKSIIAKVLDFYEQKKDTQPSRLVIHKTSRFWKEEKKGFNKASKNISEKDYVTIYKNSTFRAFAEGDYPVLRGTMITADPESEYLLFTKGYIPSLQTYPEPRIPSPVRVILDEEESDSRPAKICKEILAFTKMDWNTSHFCRKMPVTIAVADKVGDILSEAGVGSDIDPHYYYYM